MATSFFRFTCLMQTKITLRAYVFSMNDPIMSNMTFNKMRCIMLEIILNSKLLKSKEANFKPHVMISTITEV